MTDLSEALAARDHWLDQTLSLREYQVGSLEGSRSREKLQHWLAHGGENTRDLPAKLIQAQKKVWELMEE